MTQRYTVIPSPDGEWSILDTAEPDLIFPKDEMEEQEALAKLLHNERRPSDKKLKPIPLWWLS
jgi:hypothetical protein